MPPRKYSWKIGPQDTGSRLDHWLSPALAERLARPVSKGEARKLVVAGAVYLNGRRVRIASKSLINGAKVDVYVDEARMRAPQAPPVKLERDRVLFEDEWLIAVDKPPALPTQPTLDEARDNLFAAVKRLLGPDQYVGLHHRLDRDTSGVVLFTKKKEANAGVGEAFAAHTARKKYLALVQGSPGQDRFSVENFLAREPGKAGRMRAVRSGGDRAVTEFQVVERFGREAALVEASPITGRMHQIRVHLAGLGLPILGDATYGRSVTSEGSDRGGGSSRPLPMGVTPVPRLMLHAASLTFPHPISNLSVSVESPLPEDFTPCLQQLRKATAHGGQASARAGNASSTTARSSGNTS